MSHESTEKIVQVFKTLSDATRFELLTLLLTHDLCVGALARRLRISEAAVSQHLKQLREAGLVKGEKRGYWTHYKVERSTLEKVAESVAALTARIPCIEGVCGRAIDKEVGCAAAGIEVCRCRCRSPEEMERSPENLQPRRPGSAPEEMRSARIPPRDG